MPTERETALERIERAFADVPRPRNDELLHPQCFDDGDIQALYGIERWQDVPDDVIEREYAALSFLSAAAFRYFLPAYLRWVLRHDDEGQAVIGSTLAALDPGRFGSELEAFQRSKYVTLTPAEREAIAGFVDVMRDHAEIGDAAAEWRSDPPSAMPSAG
jgi:hypothetical protein